MGGDHRSAAIEAQADTILSLLAEQPDATLVEYQEALAKTGHRFSVSTIWRFFDRRELTLKNVWPAPSARGFVEIAVISLLQRIRPRRRPLGQDGDTRALVLIKLPASSAVF